MDRKEPIDEELLRAEEVGEVGTAEAETGSAITRRIDRYILVEMASIVKVQPSASHPGLTIAGDARGEDGVKQVHTTHHRLKDVNR